MGRIPAHLCIATLGIASVIGSYAKTPKACEHGVAYRGTLGLEYIWGDATQGPGVTYNLIDDDCDGKVDEVLFYARQDRGRELRAVVRFSRTASSPVIRNERSSGISHFTLPHKEYMKPFQEEFERARKQAKSNPAAAARGFQFR